MKHVLLGLAACTWSLAATAQQFQCATDLLRAEQIAADPTYLEREAAHKAEIIALIRNNAQVERGGDEIITLPVVFHVLHLGGIENISDEQINDELRVLNADFRALNPSAAAVHPAFRDLVGDAKLQFVLPTRDPQGNCTSGIERIRTPETLRGMGEAKLHQWPRDKYINIWVVRDIESGAAGYATLPWSLDGVFGRLADGIVVKHDYVGEIGTGNPGRSLALSHEVGHFLGLLHVWGNGGGLNALPDGHMIDYCDDDGVEDTPRTRGWGGCPDHDSNTNGWGGECNALDLRTYVFDFDAVTTTSGTTDPTPMENPSDVFLGDPRERAQFTSFTATGVSANSARDGVFSFTGWGAAAVSGETDYAYMTDSSIDPGKYYTFKVDPNVTDQLYLDSIGFKLSRNANGIRTFAVKSSLNNFGANLPMRAGGNPNVSFHPGNIGFITSDQAFDDLTIYVILPANAHHIEQPITFRFYAWNSETADGRVRVCSNSTPVDLFKRLGGGPQTGGTWSGPSEMSGFFDPATMEAGTYTYTVEATGPCPAYTATVEVSIIEAPEAPVISGSDSFCTGGNVVLTSSLTSNIRWSSGQTTATITVNSANTFTVSTTANGCTSTSEPFVVSVVEPVSAGTNGTLSICSEEGAVPVSLFNSLRGTPSVGGTWSGPSEVIDGLYDPATMEPGEYVYTVESAGPCPAATATVTVSEVSTANAGTNSTASICNNASAALFAYLSGGPQPGGTWYAPDNTPMDGIYNAVTMNPGAFQYRVDLGDACGMASATVTVTEINAPNVPTITGNNAFCEGGNVLLASSSNVSNRWSPGGATTPGYRVTAPGSYTVRVSSGNGCSSVSAPFVVTASQRVNAGGDGQLVACEAAENLELFAALKGDPNVGGTWSGPSAVTDGLYQPASMTPGIYKYVVAAASPCLNDTAIVTVTESTSLALQAGTFGIDDVTIHGSTNLIENVENFMEYSYCPNHMFTRGQTELMRATLNSPVGERNGLGTEQNLQFTGVAEGYRAACEPKAAFYARTELLNRSQPVPYAPTLCTGEQVQFIDNSTGTPTSWEWSFPGGTPATSTVRNPVVTYDSPGYKSVTLTVTNANGSANKTDDHAVLIGGSPNDRWGTYHEGFENGDGLAGWISFNHHDNPAENPTSWRRTTSAGYASSACAMLNSGTRDNNDLVDPANGADYDDLISPTFDLSGMSDASFNFRYAYSTGTDELANITERLQVSISTDCGKTWVTLPGGDMTGADLVNNGNNPEMPPPAWAEKTMVLSAARRVQNVRFRFRYISSVYSGNLFIDNINILGAVGIQDLSAANFMSLHPNPTNDQFTLGVHGMDKYETAVTITDIRGAVVYRNILRPTNQSMQFSASELGLSDGLYLINASNDAGSHTQKLMVGR